MAKTKSAIEDVQTFIDVAELEAHNAFVKPEAVTRAITDGQSTELKNQLSALGIQDAENEEEKAEWMEDWKNKSKPVKTEMRQIIQQLRDEEITTIEVVYGRRSEDGGKMHLYSEEGEFIMTREIKLEEQQGALGEG